MGIINVALDADELRNSAGKIMHWVKSDGETVSKDDLLAIIETNKVSLELLSPASGTITILKNSGEEVYASDTLAKITIAKTSDDNQAEMESAGSYEQINIESKNQGYSPAVRALLHEHNLSADMITPTGKDGRLSKSDVQAFLSRRESNAKIESRGSLIPFSEKQKAASLLMCDSMAEIPHVTAAVELDLMEIMQHRELFDHAIRPTFTAYFIECLTATLRDYPIFNGHYSAQGVISMQEVNIGVVTSLPDHNLVIPTLKNADDMSLLEISKRLAQLKMSAMAGTLKMSDMQNATFSISNYGSSGAIFATPIIIPRPQLAIIGIGKVEWRQKFIKENGVLNSYIHPTCYATLTIDHRAINGSLASEFLMCFSRRVAQYGQLTRSSQEDVLSV